MNIKDVLNINCVKILDEYNKNEALIDLIDQVCEQGEISEREELIRDIFYREQLMSTGIGLGIGIPHVRSEYIKEPCIAVGVQKKGIRDYTSLDNQPVRIIVMILVGKDCHRQYLRLLSQMVALLKKKDNVKKILRSAEPEDVYSIIMEETDD